MNEPGDPVDGALSRLDQESREWVRGLRASGAVKRRTDRELYELLLRVARSEVHRRGAGHGLAGPELDDLAHHAAADALLTITGKVAEFRGDSKFTTWAYKFVQFEVSHKLGRHFWRRASPPMDAEDWGRLPARFGVDPHTEAESRELYEALHRAVDTVLTSWQRRVFVALVLNEMPLDVLVDKLGTNRNAIYKVMFDARRKLRTALVAEGYLEEVRSA